MMVKAATVEINPAAQTGYTPITVNRDNTWRFEAGNRVHELIDTEGNVYTMQSFSRIVDEALSYEDLETLGDRLSLPDGWRYRVRMLEEDSMFKPSERLPSFKMSFKTRTNGARTVKLTQATSVSKK